MKKILVIVLVSIFCIKCEKSKDNSKYDNVDIIANTGQIDHPIPI
jgi:uncharacterized protein YcfL